MPDAIDDAQDAAESYRIACIAQARQAPGPAPDIIDGVVCCAGCGDPIPEARLKALPGVGLCVVCQQDREEEGR